MNTKKILFLFTIICAYTINNSYSAARTSANLAQNSAKNGYYKNYKSIMFSQQNIDEISTAITNIRNRTRTTNIETIGSESTSDLTTIGQSIFYLNSILYISDSYWTVWLNENKITNETNGENNIKIIKLNPLKAEFAWSFGLTRWDSVNPNKTIPESMYTIKDNEVTLYFSLRPNQTFIPAENRIVEGKIKQEAEPQNQQNNQQQTTQQPQISPEDSIFF